MGKVNLGDMAFLELTGNLPNARQSRMFNAMLITLVEHGIVPSTLATRLTLAGAPESLQGAVAAGLLGLGNVVVGSMENAARLLKEALPDPAAKVSLPALADEIITQHRQTKRFIPGIGHNIHKPLDPRAEKLFSIAKQTGFSGPYVRLMRLVQKRAEIAYKLSLPVNATGAIGAICCEMGMPWQICRGIGVIARSIGLVGHIQEEFRQPLAGTVWQSAAEEASAHIKGSLRTGKAKRKVRQK